MTDVSTSTNGRKRGRPQSEESVSTKQKKARVYFEELDLAKDLLVLEKA